MIKIEKIQAVKPTIVRNGTRQPLLLHSLINKDELATIEAVEGTITYSVDELELKEMVFEAPKAAPAPAPAPVAKPVIKQPAPKAPKPAA